MFIRRTAFALALSWSMIAVPVVGWVTSSDAMGAVGRRSTGGMGMSGIGRMPGMGSTAGGMSGMLRAPAPKSLKSAGKGTAKAGRGVRSTGGKSKSTGSSRRGR